MILQIPIFVEPQKQSDTGNMHYALEPLFLGSPHAINRDLYKAVTSLRNKLSTMLNENCAAGLHEQTAAYAFSPDLDLHNLELRLDLKTEFFHGWFPVITFGHLGRTLAFSPKIRDCCFEIEKGDRLLDRATEAYRRYFRDLEKKEPPPRVKNRLQDFLVKTRPWITEIDLEVSSRQRIEDPAENLFALLGGQERMEGSVELRKVGQCLDDLYPDELQRALYREAQVEEIHRLLEGAERRPILLVGPRLVGKTTLLHEVVYRRVAARDPRHRFKENIWRLSPQRLVSGMSYVGQWENRLLAILKHVGHCRHILYFEDLLGLYHAGVHSSSSLSAAHVLKPYVERHEIQIVAEMTPQQLRVFREQDRGFADLFHLVNVVEPSEEDSLKILLGMLRNLEDRYQVEFDLDVLPTAIDLTRRYQRDAAQPGKAARLLQQMAVSRESSAESALDGRSEKQ